MQTQNVPHLGSIRNTAADFGIGEWTIRQWVKQKRFPVITSGRKILINYDVFISFLNADQSFQRKEKVEHGGTIL